MSFLGVWGQERRTAELKPRKTGAASDRARRGSPPARLSMMAGPPRTRVLVAPGARERRAFARAPARRPAADARPPSLHRRRRARAARLRGARVHHGASAHR